MMMEVHSAILLTVLGILAGPLQTQNPRAAPMRNVTVSGCVAQAQRTGSLADDSGAGVAATPNTAPTEANSAELLDAFLLTNATPVLTDKRTGPTSYTLQGREQEISKHKGHTVEVTGRILPPRGTAGAPSAKVIAPGIARIVVGSVKMVSAECPTKTP